MPKCIACQEEINHLIKIRSGWSEWTWDGTKTGTGPEQDNNRVYFRCPKCGGELFSTEQDAKEFLRRKND